MEVRDEILKKACDEWIALLGRERVLNTVDSQKRYGVNELAVKRDIPLAVLLKTKDEVSKAIKIAARNKVPVYPISTGNNWGYGASSPVTDGCVIFDLSGMDRIIDFDSSLGTVTLEPGVTPKRLSDYIKENKLPYLVPVSGAGPYCSILGNALERGYGVTPFADHFGAVTSIKAVLPDGSFYEPVLSSMGGELVDRSFKWGVGPYLDGIFSQGNYGVVVEMTLVLAPVVDKIEGFIFALEKESHLEEAVNAVSAILKTVGNITGMINLMNSRRVLSMVENYPFDSVKKGEIMNDGLADSLRKKNYLGKWTVGGIIYGDSGLVGEVKRLIRKKTAPFAKKLIFFNRSRINLLKGIFSVLPKFFFTTLRKQVLNLDETFKVAEGAPCDTALALCYWKAGKRPQSPTPMNPAHDGCGVIWYSPLVPMLASRVRLYVDMVEKVCVQHRIEPLITLTSLSHRCFDSTVPILFDPKDEDETKRAHACYLALFEEGKRNGFIPYRFGIDHMGLIDKNSGHGKLASKIKAAIDPDGIISPGRYTKE